MLRARPVGVDDAVHVARHLRAADLQEIKAFSGEDPLIVLQRSVAWSEPGYTIIDLEEKPLALFGAIPHEGAEHVGIVWLLASTDLIKYSFTFLRHCRKWVEKFHERYSVLGNCVDARNDVHIRWLKWCKFTFQRRIEHYGAEKRPFYEFTKVRNAVGLQSHSVRSRTLC